MDAHDHRRACAPDEDDEPETRPFCWTVSRCVSNLFLCLLLLLFQLVLALAVYVRWGSFHAAFALVFLTIALFPFYGVYRYVLGAKELRVYGPLFYAEHSWTEFAGWRVYEDELRLVFKDTKRRSVVVLHAPGRITQVMTEVQRRMPPATLDELRR